jgi:peptidyl-prolyl cis-trans isomerase C
MPWMLRQESARPQQAGVPDSKDNAMSISTFTAPPRRAIAIAGVTAALALLLAAGALAQDKDPVVATVNGLPIHQSDVAAAEEEAGQLPPMSPDAKQDYLIQFLSDTMLLSKAAEDKKMADTDTFKRKLAFAREKLLMEALLQQVGKAALTDEAMHKVYDDAVKRMKPEEEVRARHILIRATPSDEKASKEAKDKIEVVIARLKRGEDFVKVAEEVTEDPSGKANGGDLGYFTKEQMVPEFSDVAFKLDKGQISDPVKTQFGWHVIKVEDKRTKPLPSFEEVKPQIEQYVTRKAQADLVSSLRANAKIVRLDKPATKDTPVPDVAKPQVQPAEPKK